MRKKYEKPQMKADERRFVNLNIQHFSEFYQRNSLIISPQRSQSLAIPANKHETAPSSRRGTRMTQIARIFADPCASALSVLSVFYRIPSAFICVHLRIIFVSAYNYQIHSCLNLLENKPHSFGIDERRLSICLPAARIPVICVLAALVLAGAVAGEVNE
jgi:hypothetical protein